MFFVLERTDQHSCLRISDMMLRCLSHTNLSCLNINHTPLTLQVPVELIELGKACLAHDWRARPSASAACAVLRGILRRLQQGEAK